MYGIRETKIKSHLELFEKCRSSTHRSVCGEGVGAIYGGGTAGVKKNPSLIPIIVFFLPNFN